VSMELNIITSCMGALVIYDSMFGNTERIIREVKGKAVRAGEFKGEMLKGISLLVVGSPIQE
jgi:hypothetical protein